MNRHINYEDNIFILNTGIRNLRDLLFLDADKPLFYEKAIRDLRWTDSALGLLLESLNQNKHLIDRNEQYNRLLETEYRLASLVEDVLAQSGGGNRAVPVCSLFEELAPEDADALESVLASCRERQGRIREKEGSSISAQTETQVVSQFELSELLKA
jgi:hypothetical protein